VVSKILLWATVFAAIWAIKRDVARRDGVSAALWIPTLWVGIMLSRPLSAWLSGRFLDRSEYSLDGSPMDRLLFLALIIAAWVIVLNRKPDWSSFLSRNWPIVLFYFYLLVSVFWADSIQDSFKRWFKEVGNIIVIMLILTETNPQQALRAVFVRCSYLLIPLSIVFLRYFPNLGRRYSRGGELEVIGVTDQKNSLGAMIVVCCLLVIWDLLENNQQARKKPDRVGTFLEVGILILGVYLLHACDSKTSMVCLALGGAILATSRMPVLRNRVGSLGLWTLGTVLVFNMVDAFFGLKEVIVKTLGRDMTFTGRTNSWREIMQLHTDPLLGTGFYSFWSDPYYISKLPEAVPRPAHNGYLEVYLDGGSIGVLLLAILLGVTALRINKEMRWGGTYALVRYAALVVAVIANFSESYFARMAPVGFLFLLAAIEVPRPHGVYLAGGNSFSDSVPQRNTADGMHGPAMPGFWK
jgi:exopolysaccharide production protein ExoQ